MQKIIMTKDIIKNFSFFHRTAKWTPHRPYCSLCTCFDRRVPLTPEGYLTRRLIGYIAEGEECYMVKFAGNKVGYYHVKCMDEALNHKTMNAYRDVRALLMLDVDRYKNLDTFIHSLDAEQLTDKRRIERVMQQFSCSYTTAWRKLRAYKQNA